MLGLTRTSDVGQRDRLLDSARQIFGVRAYDQVTIADVAVIAGVPIERVYDHFVNKRALYLDSLHALGEDLIRRTRPVDGDGLGPTVRYALTAFLAFVSENPVLYKALVLGGPGVDEMALDVVRRVEQSFTKTILDTLGVTRPSPHILVEMAGWMAFVRHTAAAWLDQPGLTQDELLSIQLRHLMNALRIGGGAAA